MPGSLKYIIFSSLVFLYPEVNKAQDKNIYQVSEANIVRLNGDSSKENFLRKILIILPGNSNKLKIESIFTFNPLEDSIAREAEFSSIGTDFNLDITVNRSEIQEYLTSAKTFRAHADLTINHITRDVLIDYVPLPSGTEENGNFNISVFVQFNSCEFNLCKPGIVKLYIIKIQNGMVNST